MVDSEFIESRLVNRTNAMLSDTEAKNNRWHYRLIFDENIRADWFEQQVEKVARETGRSLEPYKFGPANSFIVAEVREVERREGIDEGQNSLNDFS